jgi:hypothetical protein
VASHGCDRVLKQVLTYILEQAKLSKKSCSKWLASSMVEELTTEELSDLRVILVHFMADKEAHKKIPCLPSRALKLWSQVDRIYKSKQKGNCGDLA